MVEILTMIYQFTMVIECTKSWSQDSSPPLTLLFQNAIAICKSVHQKIIC